MNLKGIDPEQYKMNYEPEPDILESILKQANYKQIQFEEPFSHNVTSMSKCLRQRWFKWYDYPRIKKEPDPIYEAWGWMGNAVEDHIIDLTKKAGIYRAEQVRVKQRDPNISGAIDIIIELDGRLYPVEVKSAKTESFQDTKEFVCQHCRGKMWKTAKFCKLCGAEEKPIERVLWPGAESKISFDYYCQLQMYLYLVSNSGKVLNGKPVIFDQGFLWYYNKNTGDQVIHRVQYDERIVDWLIEKTIEFDQCIESGDMPARMFHAHITRFGIGTKSDWHCRFCDYKYNCYENEILQKNPKFFEKERDENGN